ncbi:hypothetical protein MLD38_003001 [Melastoma candidum]|uniref:Uncharacterized protein n=1 Tax=Melastoma candidum TaxID=119954 RepID=A0ACB9S2I7_9MYRT|nr:hypothetical protein MLD38_003001 [Melastoma candidum]
MVLVIVVAHWRHEFFEQCSLAPENQTSDRSSCHHQGNSGFERVKKRLAVILAKRNAENAAGTELRQLRQFIIIRQEREESTPSAMDFEETELRLGLGMPGKLGCCGNGGKRVFSESDDLKLKLSSAPHEDGSEVGKCTVNDGEKTDDKSSGDGRDHVKP